MTREKLREKFAKEDEDAIVSSIQLLAQSDTGQIFLNWLLAIGKFGQQPFSGADPHITSFNCGTLNVGLQLVSMISNLGPGVLPELMRANDRLSKVRENALSDAPRDDVEGV